MVHLHEVRDSDTHFIIDPITRAITNIESKKTMLMQYDHNSEQFTFELDRYVENHDMTLCNRVEVHYNNVASGNKQKNCGVYEVQDLAVSEDDETKVAFTWMVSQNATLLAGSLNFVVLFACVEDGRTTYRWNTNVNNSISISAGIDNGEAVEEALLPDVLAQWKHEIFSTNFAYEAALENGFTGSITDWLATLKGDKGDLGLYVGPDRPTTSPFFWFDTSGNRLANTIFDTSNDDSGTVFIQTGSEVQTIENATIDDDVTSTSQYNFTII